MKFLIKLIYCKLFLLLLIFCNCRYIIKPIDVNFKSFSIKKDEGLVIKLKIKNPNLFSINVTNLEYNLFIDEKLVGYGIKKDTIRLRSKAAQTFDFPFKTDLIKITSLSYLILQDSLNMRIEGSYLFKYYLLKSKRKLKIEKKIQLNIFEQMRHALFLGF